ncbi:MAG: type IX secretion system protein PorQ [Bacteroidales bacterium]|jgi:hypothetical protein|nr:type IX secretion system protein PorQ [Bacteroidales bacterium]
MKIKRGLILLLAVMAFFYGEAQIGGSTIYNFLNVSNSSRLTALGGTLISVQDKDPTLIMQNPSSIAPCFSTSLVLNAADYFTNSAFVSALYSHTFKKAGSFAAELRYLDYGKFLETDNIGNELGYFRAGDFAFTLGWGRQLDSNFSIGANLKLIYSSYENYNSFGIAADVAGTYHNTKKNISLTLLLKNMGSPLDNYLPGQFERIPFDIQLAFSQKFKFIPVRYHISLHSLYRWNMRYVGSQDPFLELDASINDFKYPSKTALFFDNMFRHLVVGIEIIPVKQLSLQFSYNHNRRQEMKVMKRSFAGFSYGFMINIHSIQIGFSRTHYGPGATPNYFTFAANVSELSQLAKQKKIKKLERLN